MIISMNQARNFAQTVHELPVFQRCPHTPCRRRADTRALPNRSESPEELGLGSKLMSSSFRWLYSGSWLFCLFQLTSSIQLWLLYLSWTHWGISCPGARRNTTPGLYSAGMIFLQNNSRSSDQWNDRSSPFVFLVHPFTVGRIIMPTICQP